MAYVLEILYIPAIGLIKSSILLFYLRIFPQKNVRMVIHGVQAIVAAWTVSITIAFLFQCAPVHKAWEFTIPGHCVVIKRVWLGNAIPNILTDLAIIIIPLPLVWALQISRPQKYALCGIFLTGLL